MKHVVVYYFYIIISLLFLVQGPTILDHSQNASMWLKVS